jgi:hypothetical protein
VRAKTKDELLSLYHGRHGSRYDYSLLDLKNKVNGKVKIICREHGLFLQNHYDHIRAGCPDCGKSRVKEKLSKIKIGNLLDLEKICLEKFGAQFDFSAAKFLNTGSKLIVTCKKHDMTFQNTAHHIVRGAGCPACKKEKVSQARTMGAAEFIQRAQEKHHNKYDYSLVEYKNLTEKVAIICQRHGSFEQKPREHLSGSGCQLCSASSISKVSQEWLDQLKIMSLVREYRITIGMRTLVVDGYDSATNTVYEFYGDYWHGNPKIFLADMVNRSLDKPFGSLYNETIIRENLLRSAGFNLVTIWESDYHGTQ